MALRCTVTEVEHRFFLALLLNVPETRQILKLVAERFPGPAEVTVGRWVREMSEAGVEDSGLVALALRGAGLADF